MSKFSKRISKLVDVPVNCLVVGNGFGFLEEILEVFQTVFVISLERPAIKDRKLIYRENFDNLSDMSNIQVVFVDLSYVDKLEMLPILWTRNKCLVAIEGNDPIERVHSGPLYQHSFRCVDVLGFFHLWKQK